MFKKGKEWETFSGYIDCVHFIDSFIIVFLLLIYDSCYMGYRYTAVIRQ